MSTGRIPPALQARSQPSTHCPPSFLDLTASYKPMPHPQPCTSVTCCSVVLLTGPH